MAKIPEIPFSYGELVSVNQAGAKFVLWFKDPTGTIRGLIADVTNPAAPVLLKDEILFKRKTEGRTRRSKLPPVGASIDTTPVKP